MSNFTTIKQRVLSDKEKTITKAEAAEKQANVKKIETASKLTDESIYKEVSKVQREIVSSTNTISEQIQDIVQDETNVELAIEVQTESNSTIQDVIVSAEEFNTLKTTQERQISHINEENKEQVDDLKKVVKEEKFQWEKDDKEWTAHVDSEESKREKRRSEKEAETSYEHQTSDKRSTTEHENDVRQSNASLANRDKVKTQETADRDSSLKEREGKVEDMNKDIEAHSEKLKDAKAKANDEGAKEASEQANKQGKLLAVQNTNKKDGLQLRKTSLEKELEEAKGRNKELVEQHNKAITESSELAKSAVSQSTVAGGTK